MPSEIELTNRIQAGCKEAASELLQRYHGKIFGYLRRLCGNSTTAEDLTQKAFLRCWQKLHLYNPKYRFSAWIFRIAYHIYVDWTRVNRPETCVGEEWWNSQIDQNSSPFESIEEKEIAERLFSAVEALDENKRVVTHLHYYEYFSINEIADILGIAVTTAKYRRAQAIKELKNKLGEDIAHESKLGSKKS